MEVEEPLQYHARTLSFGRESFMGCCLASDLLHSLIMIKANKRRLFALGVEL